MAWVEDPCLRPASHERFVAGTVVLTVEVAIVILYGTTQTDVSWRCFFSPVVNRPTVYRRRILLQRPPFLVSVNVAKVSILERTLRQRANGENKY